MFIKGTELVFKKGKKNPEENASMPQRCLLV